MNSERKGKGETCEKKTEKKTTKTKKQTRMQNTEKINIYEKCKLRRVSQKKTTNIEQTPIVFFVFVKSVKTTCFSKQTNLLHIITTKYNYNNIINNNTSNRRKCVHLGLTWVPSPRMQVDQLLALASRHNKLSKHHPNSNCTKCFGMKPQFILLWTSYEPYEWTSS